jgi:hypothetical protein
MLQPFAYGPALQAGQIRLLKIKRGSSRSSIDFDLHVVDQGSCEYFALSYAWLSPDRNEEAVCNGQSLMITSSLKAALLRLGEKYAEDYFWIDAVCINQDDDQDKSIQVRHMSQIYHNAQVVLVWLGEEDESTAVGLQLFSALCNAFPSCNGDDIRSLYLDHSLLPDPYELEKAGTLDALGIPSDTTSAPWRAAGKLLNASWFERRWILQEVASATAIKFLIGSHVSTPEILLGGAYRIADYPEFRHALNDRQRVHCDRVETIVQLLRLRQEPWLHESFCEILLETAFFKSSDLRDRVFAMIGCLKGFTDPAFWSIPRKQLVNNHWEILEEEVDSQRMLEKLDRIVDYSKTMPQVLIDVATCEEDRDEFILSIFRGLCHVDVLADDVPSWVATWEFSTPRWRSLWLETIDPLNDGSYDGEQAELMLSPDKTVLETKVVLFDNILTISDPTFDKDGLPLASDDPHVQKRKLVEDLQEKCDWLVRCERISEQSSYHANVQDCLDRFLQCYNFGADYDEDFGYVAAYQAYLRYGAFLWAKQEGKDTNDMAIRFGDRCNELGVLSKMPDPNQMDEAALNDYATSLNSLADSWRQAEPEQRYGRRFFATRNGKIGWAPQGTQIGDELCVVFGFATPFAIRKVKDGNAGNPAQYRVLGACYLHDYMDGEVFLDDEAARVNISFV